MEYDWRWVLAANVEAIVAACAAYWIFFRLLPFKPNILYVKGSGKGREAVKVLACDQSVGGGGGLA